MWRIAGAAALLAGMTVACPVSAQFFLQSHQFADAPVKGDEPGMTVAMPGATAIEQKAALAWTMRSALNLAALQCQFEPTLHAVDTYNAILKDHDAEFDRYQAVLQKYYARTPGAGRAIAGKGTKAGQAGFDQFGTRTYSAFSTVQSQYGFCQTAAAIGREAVFAPRGTFGDLAERRMRQLRNSLVAAGEERFPYYLSRFADTPRPAVAQLPHPPFGKIAEGAARREHRLAAGEERFPYYLSRFADTPLPRLDVRCWNKKGEWQTGKCGAQNWPPAGTGVAVN